MQCSSDISDSCVGLHALACIDKEVKFHFRLLIAENGNNSTTCKYDCILDVFSLCFTRCKVIKYKQKSKIKEKRKIRAKGREN